MTRSDRGVLKFSDMEIIERHSCPEPNSGCWLWLGNVNSWGYGRLGRQRSERQAHRLSYRAYRGPIPEGTKVLHKCDTPACVNPFHLFLGSLSDNVQDAIAKGRHIAPKGEGHPSAKLTAENVALIRSNPNNETTAELAKRFGVSRRAIAMAAKGETWSR